MVFVSSEREPNRAANPRLVREAIPGGAQEVSKRAYLKVKKKHKILVLA